MNAFEKCRNYIVKELIRYENYKEILVVQATFIFFKNEQQCHYYCALLMHISLR